MITFMDMNAKLGELIRNRLIEINMSQTELADGVGMTSSQISRIISGERGTTIENLMAIADTLVIDRELILRVAANLQTKNEQEEWVEKMNHKMQLLPPAARKMAEKLLDALLAEEKPAVAEKKVKSKA
jgi:transcriptional regulator with XRE-family HTH domain